MSPTPSDALLVPSGTIALQGGGPFTANDDLDRELIAAAGAARVVVLPTADAFEHPERLVAQAMNWAERLDVEVAALMVMRRAEARDEGAAEVVREARAVYVVGDQQLHLKSVLKDTPLFDALGDVLNNGGVVAACAGSAAALCDPMVDPRGGAFTLGLGMVSGLAVVTESEQWSPERLHRTKLLASFPFAALPTGSALVRRGDLWTQIGDVEVHGELP
jgi:cyanophycinase